MKLPILLLTLATSPLIAAPDGYIQQWFKAEEFEKSGDKQAEFEARLRCFELAIEAKDTNYGYAAASASTFTLYNLGRTVEAGKFWKNSKPSLPTTAFNPKSAAAKSS